LYKVFLKREDYATSELTFFVLTRIFHKTPADANNDLAALAKIGRVFCGLYTKEVAETKVLIAKEHAYTNGYPIDFIMQKGRQNVIEES
jgi:ATP-dependent Clp protease adaptor protein ClpS